MEFVERVKNTINGNKTCYKDVANCILQNLPEGVEKISSLEEISQCLERSARNEQFIENSSQALRGILCETNNNNEEDIPDTETAKQQYEAIKKRFNDPKTVKELVKDDPDVKWIKDIIRELKQPEIDNAQSSVDEEIVTTQETINLIDPYTKKMMENPVRNIHCNHVYEKETTLALIKQKKRKGIRCPYLGCQNKTPLDPQDLLEAVDFKREIAKMKQSEL
ncbi:UNVERIFIED_CONTAM: hypothetical protein RMT77_002494 [Armadillidium vulgare]